MAAGALLLRGHWRTRWRRQAILGASLALGLVGVFLVAMLMQGAQEGVVRPLHDMLSGDVRITWGSADIAGGETLADYHDAANRLRAIDGVVVAPRWETSQVTVRRSAPENWTGGLLVGIDTGIREETDGLRAYVTWGTGLGPGTVADPATGLAYVPLVVGEAAARRLNLTLRPDGQPDFAQPVDITSGRFSESGDPRPISAQGVVVGTYTAGIDTMDRFTVFAPIEEARRLVGGRPGDPSANAVIVWHASVRDVEGVGLEGAHAQDAMGFAFDVMGTFLLMLRVAAALAVALVLLVFGAWLVHEAGTVVARDRPVVASLRAVGIPFQSILNAYAGLVAGTVGAALAGAIVLVLLVSWLAPPLRIDSASLHLAIPWSLRPEPLVGAVVATAALASAATWAAARRLQRIDVAEALRP